MMRRLSTAILCCQGLILLLASPFAHAQEGLTRAPALKQLAAYVAKAQNASPAIQAAAADWRASLERVPQAESLPDPRLTFGYFIEPVETRTGPQRARYGVSQTVPWPGKLGAAARAALEAANARQARVQALRLEVVYKVKSVFYEYAYLGRALKITRETMELLRFVEDVANARYSVGAAPYGDVVKAQVELGVLEDRLRSLEDRGRPLTARLNALMDQDSFTALPLPPAVPVMRLSLADSELLAEATVDNPEVEALGYEIAARRAEEHAAEKDYYPDLTFGLESVWTDGARDLDINGYGNDPVAATVSLNLPLQRERRRAAVRQARQQAHATDLRRRALAQDIQADLQMELYQYRDAGRRIALYRDTLIPKAEEGLAVALEAYQSGGAASVDLLDAERTLLELRLAEVRALTDQAVRLAAMERLLGREIPCTIHGTLNDNTQP